MTRPRRRRAAACLLAGLLTALMPALMMAGPVPAATAAVPEDPLRVTIDRVTPSVIPTRGPLTVTGRITNSTDSEWSDLKVYLLTSFTPFTTGTELTEAAATDPSSYIGDRLAEAGQFVEVPDLGPGESARYRLRLPRRQLNVAGDQGVYWLGVQVLGAEDGQRFDGADGRARTFLPLMRPNTPRTTSLALMLQFRGRIAYDREGHAVFADVWRRALSDRGRFGRLVELSRSAGSFPLTWVVDAALVDLAEALAAGNPGYSLSPADGASPTPTATPGEDAEGSEDPEGPEDPEESENPEAPERSPEAQAVGRWLADFRNGARQHDVLSLPYGDVDVAAAYLASYGGVVTGATELAKETLNRIEVPSTSVIDPPDGELPWEAIDGIDESTPVILGDTSVTAPGPKVAVIGGPSLTLSHTTADDGVPGASNPTSALSIRQRILAEAAVHALSRNREAPLVVQLPHRWDPGSGWLRADFFGGLDVPWLTATGAGSLVRNRPTDSSIPTGSEALRYDEETPTIPVLNFVAALNLIDAGHTLDVLLPENDAIERQLTGYAYLGTSVQHRAQPTIAAGRTKALVDSVNDLMEDVTVSGPTFVTMSSEDGPFQVTLTNGLDEPVTAGVRARAVGTDKLQIPPPKPITLGPGQRQSIRMHASSTRTGIWPVVLEPVNSEGTPLGSTTEFKVRSSHVGQFIWGTLGGGSLVLFVAIFFRVRRKVKARQSTHGPLLKRAET